MESHLNYLEAVLQPSTYVDSPHVVVLIDGEPLGRVLAQRTNDLVLADLVTTLDDCLLDLDERAVVWRTILPAGTQTTIAPILVCPSDLDFSCIVVDVEIERHDETIRWTRFGLDQMWNASQVGRSVKWLATGDAFEFALENYLEFLAHCRGLKSEWWGKEMVLPRND